MTLARLGFVQEKKLAQQPSPQGQSHRQPQARLLLPEQMNYYREISFPVCASSQGLLAPFTFAFSPFSPSLLLSTLRWLEIPVQPPPHSSLTGRSQTGRELDPEGRRGWIW